MASFLKVMGLSWAYTISWFTLWLLMIYLTNVWKLNFTHAAAIVNVFVGISAIMHLALQFLLDASMGHFWMLLLSSFASSIGLGFLTMSTPPVLSQTTGNCSSYEPECIGEAQKILFYTALALLALAIFGHSMSLGEFMDTQIDDEEDKPGITRKFWVGNLGNVISILAAVIAVPYIGPWSLRFGVPAICAVVAMLIFLSGSWSYKKEEPVGSPLTTVTRVIVASASKMFHKCPKDPTQLHERQGLAFDLKPHTAGLRCLDKAAIILADQPLEQQKRLCRVTEVEETKAIIRMVPFFINSIICGIIGSLGNTFFLEQANHMNHKIGSLNLPLPILLAFYEGARSLARKLYLQVATNSKNSATKDKAPPFGVAMSIILSTLCCIVAALVEARRLDDVEKEGLIEKPYETIPMSVFWLLPQYLLLGSLVGIHENSFALFLEEKLPHLTSKYMILFNVGICGIGAISSILLVHVMGVVSGRGGRLSWFQETVNKSRLDNYYWALAVVSVINLILYILMANGCKDWNIEVEVRGDQAAPQDGQAADAP